MSEGEKPQLLFDFFIHEAENLHNRADWFLVFHGILFEAFVTSNGSTQRIPLGTLGVLVSWVWLLAGIRQQFALNHLARCMANAKIMGIETSYAFQRLWDARNKRKSIVTKLQATPAFSIVLPAAVFATWLILVATDRQSVATALAFLWIAITTIAVATSAWRILYRWPEVSDKEVESMTEPLSTQPQTLGKKGVAMKLVLTMVCVFIAAAGVYLGYREGWNGGYGEGQSAGYQLALKQAPAPPVQHRYRFERNGASLWRFDEATGESCQVESSVADAWIGGRCPIPPRSSQ